MIATTQPIPIEYFRVLQGVPKKSIPFEMKPLLEVNALLLC